MVGIALPTRHLSLRAATASVPPHSVPSISVYLVFRQTHRQISSSLREKGRAVSFRHLEKILLGKFHKHRLAWRDHPRGHGHFGKQARDIEAHLYTHGIEAAVTVARQRAGIIHDPHIVSRFCEQATHLCATLEQDANWESLLSIEPLPRKYSETELDDAMLVMADFIDLVAPSFTGHSRNVAALVEASAGLYGLPKSDATLLWRAALTHDIGKIAVPMGLWSKPVPLNESEWEKVRLHPYYTERILARPSALAELGAVASLHHEKLDGSGYHRRIQADGIPPAARLLAAANFYQARIEPRPHRAAQLPDQVAQTMRQEVRVGRLESEAVNCVLQAAGHRTPPIRRERVAGLTGREIDVLRLLARGFSNRQMAQALSITEKTAGNHVVHIYEKIGCSTRSAATLFALQHHLLAETG